MDEFFIFKCRDCTSNGSVQGEAVCPHCGSNNIEIVEIVEIVKEDEKMVDSYINDDTVFLDIDDFKEEEWEFIKDIFDVPSDETCIRIVVPQHEIIAKGN